MIPVHQLKPATEFGTSPTNVLSVPIERLESEALYRNADLREAHFNSYIARDEVRKALMRMFPNISFNAAFKYDTDGYQVNQHWAENGLRISWNLGGVKNQVQHRVH